MKLTVILVIVLAVVFLIVFFYYCPFFLWISARVSGVKISLVQLVLMRIRQVPASVIVRALIEAHKAGLKDVNRDDLEAHYLAGGNVERVVHALVSASKANIDLGFKMATAIDLAGRDVFQAVQMSVNPKVIDTPPVTAVAKDGIQLIAKARVTVRANIRQLVGAPAKTPCSPASAKASCRPSALPKATSRYSKIPTRYPSSCCAKALTQEQLLKYSLSTLPTST